MQKLVEVRKRMDTVRNIQSITRALATVSSAKLSRTRARAAGMRLYVQRMRDVLQRQQAEAAAKGVDLTPLSPFMQPRPAVRRVVLVHFAGDRGMCGSYNMAVNRTAWRFITRQQEAGREVRVFVKGLRGERYLRKKTAGCEISLLPAWRRAGVTTDDVAEIYDMVTEMFLSGEADEIHCCYTQFFSPLRRVPRVVRLLPVAAEDLPAAATPAGSAGGAGVLDAPKTEGPSGEATPATAASHRAEGGREPDGWHYEPSFEAIVAELISLFVCVQVEDVLLESYASEQGARMITMEEASERADKTLADLGVKYNRLRREVITIDLLGVLFASKMRAEEEAAGTGGAARSR
ncbi:MAG: F0F1 ATP synthase subunit gamma [Coriobacteriia bacterium]|nr:F0F1 ATP synthase subunit gamma [Coriobacteriia bacterium]